MGKYGVRHKTESGQGLLNCFKLSDDFQLTEGEVKSLVNPFWSVTDRRLVCLT